MTYPIPTGQPTTPAKDGFTANTDAMYLSVATWTDVSNALTSAAKSISEGLGHRDDFGLLSNAAQLGNMHDAFVQKLAMATVTGAQVAVHLATELNATAAAYDEADQNAAGTVKGAHS